MNIDRFNDPLWFLALLCLVPLIVRMFTQRRQVSVVFSSLSILDGVGRSWRSHVRPWLMCCLLYTSPSPRDRTRSRMPSSA